MATVFHNSGSDIQGTASEHLREEEIILDAKIQKFLAVR
jgi:hypothetical protein